MIDGRPRINPQRALTAPIVAGIAAMCVISVSGSPRSASCGKPSTSALIRVLAERIRARGVPVEILAPEAPDWASAPAYVRAIVMADTMTSDITVGNVSSWHYWIAVSKYDYRDGLIYTNDGTEDVLPTKRLWVLGQFSRFVRPGSVRISAVSTSRAIRVAGFVDPESKRISLVMTNELSRPRV